MQIALLGVLVALCALLPGRFARDVEPRDASGDPRPPGSALLYEATLDANSAASEDLETLPGIGPAKAAAILAAREERHGFCTTDEVRRAASLGGERWERVAPLIRLSRAPRCSSSSRE